MTDDGAAEPDTPPPWGLDVIVMPDNPETVEAVFAALPSEMGGLPRTDLPGRVEGALGVEYGGATLRATPIAAVSTAANQELAALEWLEMMAAGMEGVAEGSALEADAPLAWIASAEEADGETAYIAAWCIPTGSWYFDVVAETPEARLALIQSFIAAAPPA